MAKSEKKKARSFDQTDTPEPTFGNGHPLLKVDHVEARGTKGVLTGEVAEYESEFGNGFMVGVTIGGKTFDFRVKETSGNFGMLKRIGTTARALKGKPVTIGIKSFKNHDYCAIL